MAEKKDTGLLGGAAAASKKGIEELGRLVDTLGGLVPDAAVGVVNSTKGKTIHGSREADESHRFPARLGTFRCRGPVGLLAPLLHLGQLAHVGKLSTWGCGRYTARLGSD